MPLVFDGVTVIDVQDGHHLTNQRVVIVGNRIQAIGGVQTVPLPANARVVSARGKYLIPGLWDMHTHSVPATIGALDELLLANGITGVRDAGSAVPINALKQMRREILAGRRVGPPRQIFSGQFLEQSTDAQPCQRILDKEKDICVSDTADARHLVDSLKTMGVDMIKLHNVSRAVYFATAAEARRVGIPFGGHNLGVSAIEASDSGALIVDHLRSDRGPGAGWALGHGQLYQLCWGDSATIDRCQPVAEHFRRNGTWFVPTVIVTLHFNNLSGSAPHADSIFERYVKHGRAFLAGARPDTHWLRDSVARASAARAHVNAGGAMQMMQRVGLPILAGTDNVETVGPPGFVFSWSMAFAGLSLHAELAAFVGEGLTPLTAVQSATLNPAKCFQATDSLGTVAVGKLADLVLLDADPLTNITNTTTIRAVVANGRYFGRAALDHMLADAQVTVQQLQKNEEAEDK